MTCNSGEASIASSPERALAAVKLEMTRNQGRPVSEALVGHPYVAITSQNFFHDVAGDRILADVKVQNLTSEPLGSVDGTTYDGTGVDVFFFTPPAAPVTINNATGTGTFTDDQPDLFRVSAARSGEQLHRAAIVGVRTARRDFVHVHRIRERRGLHGSGVGGHPAAHASEYQRRLRPALRHPRRQSSLLLGNGFRRSVGRRPFVGRIAACRRARRACLLHRRGGADARMRHRVRHVRRFLLGQGFRRCARRRRQHDTRRADGGLRTAPVVGDRRRHESQLRDRNGDEQRILLGRQYLRSARHRHVHREPIHADAGHRRPGFRVDLIGTQSLVCAHERGSGVLLGRQQSPADRR